MTEILFQRFQPKVLLDSLFVAEKGFLEIACNQGLEIGKISKEHFLGRDYHRLSPTVLLAEFDNTTSRNLPFRVDKLKDLVAKHSPTKGDFRVVIVLKQQSELTLAGLALARLWPLYNKKSNAESRKVVVEFYVPNGGEYDLAELQILSDSIRKAQLLMDTPCSELNVTEYVEEARKMAASLGKEVSIQVIQGEELKKSFGGIHGVGKASNHPPALVVLKYTPQGASKTFALVGKGIVYDTGGLSIKGTAGMCGMKFDMGGSAAVFGAFQSLVKMKIQKNCYGLLCLAENAIGPNATRNDDILYMHSGKTVEVNNTDAEGCFY